MSTDRYEALTTIHRLAIEHGLGVATAESLTAGMVASALADTSGSSAYLRGGIVAYTIDAKVALLGVDREMAASCNCVSSTVAVQMALGAQQVFNGAELVVAVTGYAEPWPEGGVDKAYAEYAILCRGSLSTGQINLDGLDRWAARYAVATHTLCELASLMEAAYAG